MNRWTKWKPVRSPQPRVRSRSMGLKVKKGEVIALLNGQLVDSSKSVVEACSNLLKKANTDDREHITIILW